MTPSDRSAAKAALSTGRATYARLDQIRGPEDAAADLVELWGAVESAMRAMLGGSSLSGQALVRELRQRSLISLDQANALVSFGDARQRVDDISYKPTLTDVGYARIGYNELSKAVDDPYRAVPDATRVAPPDIHGDAPNGAPGLLSPMAAGAGFASGLGVGSGSGSVKPSGGSKLSKPLIGSIVGILAVVGVVAFFLFGRSPQGYDRDVERGIDLMQGGQVEAARAAFLDAAAKYPDKADPRVFLSRLSRNEGDLTSARRELVTAIKLEPKNAVALREMGMLYIAEKNPEMAKRFLTYAVEADPNDRTAQGYLGCALVQLNRADLGQRFLDRAGPGNWSACTASVVR